MGHDETFSLRQVADLTGLSEFTLRGWEGRYQAFTPDRTDTGRRRYSKQDLKRAFLLRELTGLGRRISDVARLPNSRLEKELDAVSTDISTVTADAIDNIESVLKMALLQDWDKLKKTLLNLLNKKSPISAIEKVILPLLRQMGMYVTDGRLGIAQEHVLSALIKEQLYVLLAKVFRSKRQDKKFSVIIATPEGDFHEIGILIAHLMLSAHGAKSLLLGANTPKKELCETALRFGATHVLLASTVNRQDGAQEEIYSYIHYVDQHLPKSVNLWVGGRTFEKLKFNLNRNCKYLLSPQELPRAVEESLKEK
ncbi:MAG: MerR family transcriptional regulator [Bdellovibrionales bacterium]